MHIKTMSLKDDFTKINNSILKLIKSNDEYWKCQRKKLLELYRLHLQFTLQYLDGLAALVALNAYEEIKSYRTDNLNTPSNMERLEYSEDIVAASMKFKLGMMELNFSENNRYRNFIHETCV